MFCVLLFLFLSESPTQSITRTWWARSCRILAAFDFSMCLSLSSASQGSTESNATNDEEEMKGRKGTPVFYSLYPVLSFCLPFSEFFFIYLFLDCTDWQVCWDTTRVCHTFDCVCRVCMCVFIVCLAAFCMCVLADSTALSQGSATEEMPPLLPSPQSSPASKFIHGNRKAIRAPLART